MSNDTPTQTHASPDVKSSGRGRQRSSKSASQRRTKRKVFDEQQTDEERRILRIEQRNINQVLATGSYRIRNKSEPKGEDEDPLARPTLEGVRDSNNTLFKSVTYTRELVLDADNVALLADNYAKQVEQSVQVPRYDAVKVIIALKKQCTSKKGSNVFFDWKTLGVQTGVCFNAVPSKVTFAAGKYEEGIVAKQKKAREVKQKDTTEAVQPEEEKGEAKGEKATMSVADACVLKMRKRIEKAYAAKINIADGAAPPEPLDPLDVLLDPKSFTKTRGKVGAKKGWEIRYANEGGETGEHRQAFIHINKKIWKDMCVEYEARKQLVAE